MEQLDIYKTVQIPHLRYKVQFMDMSKLKGVDIKGSGFTCISGEDTTTVFIENIGESVKKISCMPTIAHEIMHVIQILCEKFGMDVESEQEHTAYLTHYLFESLIN